MYSSKFVIVKKYVKSYGNLYEYGKNHTNCWNYWDNLWYVLQFWEKFKIHVLYNYLVIAIFTIHLLNYCDSIKMGGGNYFGPFKKNVCTYKAFPYKDLPSNSNSTHILIMPAIRVLLE